MLQLLGAITLVRCFAATPTTVGWYLMAVALVDYDYPYGSYASVGVALFLKFDRWLTLAKTSGAMRIVEVGEKSV